MIFGVQGGEPSYPRTLHHAVDGYGPISDDRVCLAQGAHVIEVVSSPWPKVVAEVFLFENSCLTKKGVSIFYSL
jgi:hypothetical protein